MYPEYECNQDVLRAQIERMEREEAEDALPWLTEEEDCD